ncbi:MAG: hydroxymethylglutaryl-CoA lyase [Chitinophagaceae bacterium]|nr:MAG: hydroxymethylglutaryl-CoA lyase [Chitinophagaceae bacterium]
MQTQLIECPRDAMQGWKDFIPTSQKIAYIQSLLQVGFHTLDAGSFVSARAIPQMADSAAVFESLDTSNTKTKLLAIVANERGAQEAVTFSIIRYIGFPFSISETFQQRNTNSSISESFERLKAIVDTCGIHGKEPVVYLSMGFGNPYNDPWSPSLAADWAGRIAGLGVKIISLADTVGLADPVQVAASTRELIAALPDVEVGVHLHSSPLNWQQKLDAALAAGCRRIDGALNGIGGCPMAGDELVGNMDMAMMIPYLEGKGIADGINQEALRESLRLASIIFSH